MTPPTSSVARGHTPTFGEIAGKLDAMGYQPIPIRASTKVPSVNGWQSYKKPAYYIKGRLNCGGHSTGLLTSTTPVIDIDVRDENLVKSLIRLSDDLIGESPVRVGSPPKAVLMFRTMEPFKKQHSPWFVLPGDNWREDTFRAHRIEILADGNQFVSYARHGGTKKPYVWSRGEPLKIPRGGLANMDEALASVFLEEAWNVCMAYGACPVRQKNRKWVAAKLPESDEPVGIHNERSGAGWWLGLTVDDLKEDLGLKRSGSGWACRCPNHMGDHDNSLNIREGLDGKLLIHCYGGCEPWEVIEAVAGVLDGLNEDVY